MNDPKLAAMLASAGVDTAGNPRWRRLPDDNTVKIHSCWICCSCWGYPRQIAFVPIEHNGRMLLITQCPKCREIVWMFWVAPSPQWTGPRQIRVEDHAGKESGRMERAAPP